MSADSGDDGRPADREPGSGLESLLAQLRRRSDQDTSPSAPIQSPHDLLSRFSALQQRPPAAGDQFYSLQQQQQQQQQHTESPPTVAGGAGGLSSSFAHNSNSFATNPPPFPSSAALSSGDLPAAPTPPVGGGFPNAQFPPSLLGSIGSGRPSSDRAATSSHLLNLLKFSGGQANANTNTNPQSSFGSSNLSQPPSVPHNLHQSITAESLDDEPEMLQQQHASLVTALPPSLIHAPAPAPSDPSGLLAALMKGTLKDEPPKQPEAAQSAPSSAPSSAPWTSTSQSNETQQYLLNLLNRPKPSQNDESFSTESSKPSRLTPGSVDNHLPGHHLQQEYRVLEEPTASASQSPATLAMPQTSVFDFEIQEPKGDEEETPKSSTLFNHHNPFDGLVAASSFNRPPRSSTTPGASNTAPSPAQSSTAVASTATTATAGTAKPVQILRKPAPQAPSANLSSSNGPSPVASPSSLKNRPEAASPSHLGTVEHPSDTIVEKETSVDVPSDETGDSDAKEESDVTADARDLGNQSEDDGKEGVEPTPIIEDINQAEIAKDLDDMAHAKTDEEFHAAAQAAGRAIQHELEKEETQAVLEDNLSPDMAKAVRDIVDEAAQGNVADSWESADAEAEGDDVIVVEVQSAPVKVYNFPMKPWISIDVQDDDKDSRPVFREDSILDIARLKKEFDQIDRNLVAASENYMVYGMSKAGGLRVIRQSDGRDAKLFTDTKDRIFNVAMSFSSDAGAIPRDSIIGTGISGTVYWVQIRDGDKDYLDYAHPELYGFALPPIPSYEGDAPGGVLKTRARTSTGHPEYFAVGRGKSINIVWPSFVMRNSLFQPGHDRVVDTEKLAKQCSLKINTGKAGKDFTFSQDDTVVVSLDKSGRVKFWDVRDLTAVRDGSDPRNPMPAHTSLEVKEPLMTLTTTPEGEKAWPTSVLLLDKMRPYQKHCALRYMIVGMKQNHTLQLWDLALGKPVQEFNLPHSKESDAVCSVMYHPPTGMIVVGHPTRNSVYFLHLSAPKYAMKSMSQVDYIQRLTARDASIPQPESTAVISGLREYSFANRGALRSLDILQNPASNADDDNPTLFELYAMHSKGVSCLFVRQAELGWTKDNKVMEPVDAVEAGKVKIGKLKSPQQPVPPAESRGAESTTGSQQTPRIIASRAAAKELFQSHPTAHQDPSPARKPMEPGSLTTKLRTAAEPRDEDSAPVSAPAPSGERVDKKTRKKKAAAAAAAAAEAAASAARGLPPVSDPDAVATSNGGGSGSSSHVLASGKTPADVFKPASSGAAAAKQPSSSSLAATLNVSQDAIDARINTMEARICERVSSSVHVAFDDMRKSIDQQFRARDADFEQKQHKLLDVVSSTLDSNTQLVLGKIIRTEFDESVVPVLRDDVARSITDHLGSRINTQVSNVLQKELQRTLPGHLASSVSNSVSSSLRSQEVSKAISDKVVHAVARHVDDQFSQTVADDVLPTISSISAQAVHTITNELHDVHQKMATQLQASFQAELALAQAAQAAQNEKIEALTLLVTRLTDTVSTMAAAQTQYQNQILKLQSNLANASGSGGGGGGGGSGGSNGNAHSHVPAGQPQPLPPPYPSHVPPPPQQQQQPQQQHQHQHVPQPHPHQHGPQHPPQLAPQHRGFAEQQAYHSPTGARGVSSGQLTSSRGDGLSPSQHSTGSGQPQPHPPQHWQGVFENVDPERLRKSVEFEQSARAIDELLRTGKYDDAMMRWLQSNGHEEELFRAVLVNYSPDLLSNLQPLVLLSVGTTVSQELDDAHNLAKKLAWVEMVILNLYQVAGQLDDQTREITPNVLLHIRSRLEQAQLRLGKVAPAGDPQLKSISRMIAILNRLVEATKPRTY